jgi:hypothetical protein
MKRLERPGQVAYRDRSWRWSLLFLFFALPVSLLMLQGELDHANPAGVTVASVGVVGLLAASMALLQSHTLLIDRDGGMLTSRRMRFIWSEQRRFPLADVKSVTMGMKIVDHPLSPRGGVVRTERTYTIRVDMGERELLIGAGLTDAEGKTLGTSLARDLRVPMRNEF